jgi:phosphodiesterase/alkaline phosphatase D-like protein
MLPRCFIILLIAFVAKISSAQTTLVATASPFGSSVWSGAVTSSTANVVVRLTTAGVKARLVVSPNPGLTPASYSPMGTTAAASGNTLTLTVQSLQADTDYFYGVEVAGVLRTETISRGKFHTFPLGRGSFKIAFASCSDYRMPDQRAFDAIAAEKPLLFIHMGDLHYDDVNTTNVDDYRASFDNVLNHPNQSALYRSVPIAYMWDDHDFCGNDSNGTAAGRDTARIAYKERTPHYPIASAGGTMAQSFSIGRVRVIMTDLRSASVLPSTKESASKSRMGAAQKAWFKQELINARDAGFPLVLWVCTDPWICGPALGDDSWGGYTTERTELANFIRDNHITNLVLLSGDMHGLAYDDGTHSDYATGGGAELNVLHAASLTHNGAPKGGPYTAGPFMGGQQYGILEVFDSGGPSVACRFTGKKVGEGDKLTYIFGSSAAAGGSVALVNISMLAKVTGGDDALTSGFVISGSTPRHVLIRAVGPTLTSFGLGDALAQPTLTVYQGPNVIANAAAWGKDDETIKDLTDAFDRAGSFRFMDTSSRDAAVVLTLQPGSYTCQVKSADGKPGSALLEVYDIP